MFSNKKYKHYKPVIIFISLFLFSLLVSTASIYIYYDLPLNWTLGFVDKKSYFLQLDAKSISYLLTAASIAVFLQSGLFYKICWLIVLLFISLINVSSWLYFDFYSDFVSKDVLLLVPDLLQGEAGVGLNNLGSFSHAIKTVLLTLLFWLFFWGLGCQLNKVISIRARLLFCLAIGLILLGKSIESQWKVNDRVDENWAVITPPVDAYPVTYFIRSFFVERSINLSSQHVEAALYLKGQVADEKFPLAPAVNSLAAEGGDTDNPNVLFVVLESVRSFESNFFSGGGMVPSLTPNLDEIASKSWAFTNFYANSMQTVRGELSILCSVYDFSLGAPFTRRALPVTFDCLPSVLNDRGYETLWMHGYDASFFSRDKAFPKLGFERLIDKSNWLEMYPEIEQLGWGVSDQDFLTHSLEYLESLDKPFFAELLTLSNHFPFDFGFPKVIQEASANSTIYNNYLRGVSYTDAALGRFWQKFQKSKLSDSTIVIIVADHGLWIAPSSVDNRNRLNMLSMQFHVPMLVWYKGIESRTSHATASQIDIFPTVLSLLNINSDDYISLGRDLSEEAAFSHFALMTGFGSFASATNNNFCVPDYNIDFDEGYGLASQRNDLSLASNQLLCKSESEVHPRIIYSDILELNEISLIRGFKNSDQAIKPE